MNQRATNQPIGLDTKLRPLNTESPACDVDAPMVRLFEVLEPLVVYKKIYKKKKQRFGKSRIFYWRDIASVIATLRIPKGAVISVTRKYDVLGKCRADRAIVTAISGAPPTPDHSYSSQHDSSFKYAVGKRLKPKTTKFSNGQVKGEFAREAKVCGPGIHFYFTRTQAVNH